MNQLEWSDALSLDLPLMDDTHRENEIGFRVALTPVE